jgi:hypothetical protein
MVCCSVPVSSDNFRRTPAVRVVHAIALNKEASGEIRLLQLRKTFDSSVQCPWMDLANVAYFKPFQVGEESLSAQRRIVSVCISRMSGLIRESILEPGRGCYPSHSGLHHTCPGDVYRKGDQFPIPIAVERGSLGFGRPWIRHPWKTSDDGC